MSRSADQGPPKHVDIALTAVARGFIDMRTFAEALVAAGAKGGADVDEVWLRTGRLQKRQLDSILLTLSDPVGAKLVPQTMAFGERPPVAVAEETPGPPPTSKRTILGTAPQANPPAGAAPTMPVTSAGPVEHLSERYRIVAPLGSGGMGEVFACFDPRLNRRVALKALRPDLIRNGKGPAILNREARLTARLEHPSIIPIYDAGEDPALGPFYVMQIVDRPSLDDLIQRLRVNPGLELEYTLRRLLRVLVQVCNAIDYAHSQQVIHCDLKPANILMGPFGEVLVVDWGLAQSGEAGAAQRGGTPGYMAPEQMAGAEIDVRVDVFSLGAILYALLTLQPAFTDAQLSSLTTSLSLGNLVPMVPVRPSLRTPERNIPQEVEDVCLKALASNPAERYQSVRELAAALETFIEGRREQDRRRARADELVASAESLGQAYQEFLDSRPQRVADLEALRAKIPPYEREELKRPIWDAEDSINVLDGLAIRTLQGAIAAYEQALDEVPDDVQARRGLAELYLMELERARARRDEFNRVYFEGLVKQYDDGALQALLDEKGAVTVNAGDGASMTIERFELSNRKLVPTDARLMPAPLRRAELETGSYLATVKGGGWTVRAPVLIKAGKEHVLTVDGAVARTAEPNMVYVPGGPTLIRGEEGQERREVEVPPFLIGELPVTFDAYLEFIRDVYRKDPRLAESCLPRSAEDAPFWRWDGAGLVPANLHLLGAEDDEAMGLPVVGVDAQSAVAYTEWLSRKTDRHYRLPNEDEWEKAARGVDGRRYPWGDQFDAAFCHMRQSRPGVPRIEQSGAFKTDVSPYGVRDMAGGVADWVRPGPRAITTVARGGAWCDWPADCRVAVRWLYWATERSTRVGFRIARSV